MPAARTRAVTVASYGDIQPSRIFDPQVVGMSEVVKTSLSASGTPASGDGSCSPALDGGVDAGGGGQRLVGGHVQEGVVALVGGGDLVQAGLGHLDRGQLPGGDLGAQRGGVEPDHVAHLLRLPQDLRHGEAAVDRRGRLGQGLGLGQARPDDVGRGVRH